MVPKLLFVSVRIAVRADFDLNQNPPAPVFTAARYYFAPVWGEPPYFVAFSRTA